MSILSQKSKTAINLISNNLYTREDTYNVHFSFYVIETNYLYKSNATVFVLYHIYNRIIIIIIYLLLIYIVILIIISTEIYMLREFKL